MNTCLREFEANFVALLSTCDFLVHNHPPSCGLIQGCKYCEKFGNVFEHGILSKKGLETNHKVFKSLI